MKKKHIRSTISCNLIYEIRGITPDDLINLIKEYQNNYPDLINWKLEVGCVNYEDTEISLTAERIETDKEFSRREAIALKAKIAATKRKKILKAKIELEEIELLEKLKKKYETGGYKKQE